MSKAVLISIQPKWCELIANEEKTVEVRKTRPNLKPPFKCYIYCTNIKNRLNYSDEFDIPLSTRKWKGNGKVIGEFICDKTSMNLVGYKEGIPAYWNLIDGSCLRINELFDYGKFKVLYGWHISDLKIYDKPKELKQFHRRCSIYDKGDGCGDRKCPYYQVPSYEYGETDFDCEGKRPIFRAPQSWCYVEELKNK